MKLFSSFLVVFLTMAVQGVFSKENKVVELTSATLPKFLSENELVLLEFYTPTCQFCRAFEPVYEEIAEELNDGLIKVGVARIDALQNTDASMQYEVETIPGIVVFKFGEMFRFQGLNRSKEKVLEFVRLHTSPVFTELNTQADLDRWQEEQVAPGVLLYLDESSPTYENDMDAANRVGTRLNQEHDFCLVKSRELINQFNCPDIDDKKPCVVVALPGVYKSKYEHMFRVSSFDSKESLVSFIGGARIPLVGELFGITKEWYTTISKTNNLPLVVVYHQLDFMNDPKKSNYIANRVRRVAKDYQGQALFTVADAKLWRQELDEQYAMLHWESRGLVSVVTPEGKKYLFKGLVGQENTFSVDGLKEWFETVLDGSAEEFLKSEDPPSEPLNAKGVTHLTRRTIDDLLYKSGKPSFVFFHAPWHAECKRFKAVFDELARFYRFEKPVQIASYDLTMNENPPGFDLENLPALYFVNAAGGKEVYHGEQTLEQITEFLAARGVEVEE